MVFDDAVLFLVFFVAEICPYFRFFNHLYFCFFFPFASAFCSSAQAAPLLPSLSAPTCCHVSQTSQSRRRPRASHRLVRSDAHAAIMRGATTPRRRRAKGAQRTAGWSLPLLHDDALLLTLPSSATAHCVHMWCCCAVLWNGDACCCVATVCGCDR